MIRRAMVLLLIAALFCGTSAYAEWRVDFESKTVDPNETGVTVNLTVYWDIALTTLSVPAVVRSITPGAFWTGTLPYDTLGNAFSHPYVHGVTWNWSNPWATLIERMRPGVPSGSCGTEGDVGYDGVSPDHFVIDAAGTMSTPAHPSGRAVMTMTFDVTSIPGDFEFDTACFTGSLHTIFMKDNAFPPVDHGPAGTGECTFNKGIISISAPPNDPPTLDCPWDEAYDIGQPVNMMV